MEGEEVQAVKEEEDCLEIQCQREYTVSDVSSTFQLVVSDNSSIVVLLDTHGYSYIATTSSDDKTEWSCTSNESDCGAVVWQTDNETFSRDAQVLHNHEPNPSVALEMVQHTEEDTDTLAEEDPVNELLVVKTEPDESIEPVAKRSKPSHSHQHGKRGGTGRKGRDVGGGKTLQPEAQIGDSKEYDTDVHTVFMDEDGNIFNVEELQPVKHRYKRSVFTPAKVKTEENMIDTEEAKFVMPERGRSSFKYFEKATNAHGKEITYEVIERATVKGEDMLLDSEGFTYTRRKKGETVSADHSTIWICSVRRENLVCSVSVKQSPEGFFALHTHHNHEIKPCEALRLRIRRAAKDAVDKDIDCVRTADDIVSSSLKEVLEADNGRLSHLAKYATPVMLNNVKRLIKRQRFIEHADEIKRLKQIQRQQEQSRIVPQRSDREITYTILPGVGDDGQDLVRDSLGYVYYKAGSGTFLVDRKRGDDDRMYTEQRMKSYITWKCTYLHQPMPKPTGNEKLSGLFKKKERAAPVNCCASLRQLEDDGVFTRSYIRHKHTAPITTPTHTTNTLTPTTNTQKVDAPPTASKGGKSGIQKLTAHGSPAQKAARLAAAAHHQAAHGSNLTQHVQVVNQQGNNMQTVVGNVDQDSKESECLLDPNNGILYEVEISASSDVTTSDDGSATSMPAPHHRSVPTENQQTTARVAKDDSKELEITKPDTHTVSYELIVGGSIKGEDIIVDSDGFTYTRRRKCKKFTVWVCSVRSKDSVCRAFLREYDGIDIHPGYIAHNHEVRSENSLVIKARMMVKEAAKHDLKKPSLQLVQSTVDRLMEEHNVDQASINWENLRRIANRTRQRVKTDVHSYSIAAELGDGAVELCISDVVAGATKLNV